MGAFRQPLSESDDISDPPPRRGGPDGLALGRGRPRRRCRAGRPASRRPGVPRGRSRGAPQRRDVALRIHVPREARREASRWEGARQEPEDRRLRGVSVLETGPHLPAARHREREARGPPPARRGGPQARREAGEAPGEARQRISRGARAPARPGGGGAAQGAGSRRRALPDGRHPDHRARGDRRPQRRARDLPASARIPGADEGRQGSPEARRQRVGRRGGAPGRAHRRGAARAARRRTRGRLPAAERGCRPTSSGGASTAKSGCPPRRDSSATRRCCSSSSAASTPSANTATTASSA